MDDAQLAGTYVHVLSLAYSAARHALTHGTVADADRPLAIAQYAQRSIDALREGAARPMALVRLTSTAPEPAPSTLNERLEAAVDHWSGAVEPELMRLVPSAAALRMLANQGAHLYAVTHQVVSAHPIGPADDVALTAFGESLACGARACQAADKPWDKLTTASRPGAEFVAASRELFNALNAVSGASPPPSLDWDPQRAMRDLGRGIEMLAQAMDITQTLPDRLLRSGLVYSPARALPSSVIRMPAHRQGKYVPVSRDEVPDLQVSWTTAHRHATQVEHSLLSFQVRFTPRPQQRHLGL